jgi:hypothetical protein
MALTVAMVFLTLVQVGLAIAPFIETGCRFFWTLFASMLT